MYINEKETICMYILFDFESWPTKQITHSPFLPAMAEKEVQISEAAGAEGGVSSSAGAGAGVDRSAVGCDGGYPAQAGSGGDAGDGGEGVQDVAGRVS